MKPILTAIALSLMALPAVAQDTMTRTTCQDSYQRITDMIDPDDPIVAQQIQSTRVTTDGWCLFRKLDPGFTDMPFDRIEWSFEDSARWIRNGIPPLAIHVRIDGFDPNDNGSGLPSGTPDLDIQATLRQIPDAGQVVLEQVVMTNDFGDELIVSGVFDRVFLSSTSMMQVSMGSAAFKAGLVSMTLEGTVENPFGLNGDVTVTGTPQSQSQAAFDAISRMPDGLIDDASRAELTAFAADLPKPVGTLEMAANSQRGLGLMQIGAAIYAGFTSVVDGTVVTDEMELMFDGLKITANWSPAAQVAD